LFCFLQANQSALHLACEVGNAEIALYLVKQGACCTAKDKNEFTPFITACYNGNLECAKLFCNTLNVLDQVDKVK